MISKIKIIAALCGFVVAFAIAPGALRAQSTGPMQPPESTKFPTPPPAAKPEPLILPPDEIIRRFAAKEDEMVRAIKGYTFQKDVRIQEIGPGNKSTGQLEIVTQLRIAPDGKMFEKPVSRQPSTLHYLDLQRGDSDLLAPTPMFPLTTAMLPEIRNHFRRQAAARRTERVLFHDQTARRGTRSCLFFRRGVGGRSGFRNRKEHG